MGGCGLDFTCHVGGLIAPLQAFWATWWPLGLFALGLSVGGVLGWRVVLAVLTLGVGYFLYDKFRPVSEPDYETGEPEPALKPKKRKTIFGN